MARRFLTVFAAILAYMVVASGLLWLLILVVDDPNVTGIAVGGAIAIILVGFVPFMAWATSRVFFFPGEGQPVSSSELQAILGTVNEFDVPVMSVKRGDTLVFTWRYVDQRWWELFASAGMSSVYELHVKLDSRSCEARLIDVTKRVSWRTGPTTMQLHASFFRGVLMGVEIGKEWGILENFTLGKIYDYQFTSSEIKNPVLNTLLRHGWSVRFAFW